MNGILTFHFAHNYGAMLQAYATNAFLNANSIESEIIDYRPSNIAKTYDYTVVDKIKSFNIKSAIHELRRKQQKQLFETFLIDYLKCTNIKCYDVLDIKKYNSIICGSDQVWNTDLTKNNMNYFLACDGKFKRIGYAVSIGNSSIVDSWGDKIKGYINDFDELSFRESTASQAVSNILSDKKIETVIDPVFLLSSEDWKKLERKTVSKIPDKFILFYALTNNAELVDQTIRLSKRTNLPIVTIHPLTKKWKFAYQNLIDVGPQEFLWLIHHAEYVCTNSFHGSAFSTIFRKKVCFASHEKLGERNKHLFSLLNINDENKLKDVIDLEKISYEFLNEYIDNSKNYLLNTFL